MTRARSAFVAALVGVGVAGAAGNLIAQKAPEFHSVLAGKKVEAPFKGQADVEFVQPTTRRDGKDVVTTIKVKNASPGPLVRFKITETWFDKAGNIVTASETTLDKPLATNAVETIVIHTPASDKLNGNGFNFSHANGTVKTKRVAKIEDPAKTAAKPATTAKK